MTKRNLSAVGLTAASIGLLLPGLFQPALTMTASVTALGQTRELFRETQSIVDAVRNLHESGNDFVAGLILLFSILVPFAKAVAVAVIVALKKPAARYRLYLFVRGISKWSMADVFAVGVFIAFLAAKATDNLDATAGAGFYYFAAYCLVSNLAFQVLRVPPPGDAGGPVRSTVASQPATSAAVSPGSA